MDQGSAILQGLFFCNNRFQDRAVLSLFLPFEEAYSPPMKLLCSQLKSTLISALALLMILTSTAMAMGQMRAAADGEMVLCTGHGPRIVPVDQNGQPVEPKVVCPDCLLDASAQLGAATSFIIPTTVALVDLTSRGFARHAPQPNRSADTTRAPPRT